MILEEARRLGTWVERHRRLGGRLLLLVFVTAAIDVIGTILVYLSERNARQTDIHTVLTRSSSPRCSS
jgi:hypothetical protein